MKVNKGRGQHGGDGARGWAEFLGGQHQRLKETTTSSWMDRDQHETGDERWTTGMGGGPPTPQHSSSSHETTLVDAGDHVVGVTAHAVMMG